MPQVSLGQVLAPKTLTSLRGSSVSIPDSDGRLTHLQFRRFAGCPVCNLHLHNVAKRVDDLKRACIREVAVFHSSAESMRPFQGELPFDVIPDPNKDLYRAFGVEASLRSVADPRAWGGAVKGMVSGQRWNPLRGEGGHLGLPADFIIDRAGKITALKYGIHADDHWSVDEILQHARDVSA